MTTFPTFAKGRNWNSSIDHPKMRELAHSLLAYETVAGRSVEPTESATLRVYGKLRKGLGEFAGVAGFHSLASRALALARTDAPSLSAMRVSVDGVLECVGQTEHPIDIGEVLAGESADGEAGMMLIARLLGLLLTFLGEAPTFSLLRLTLPGASFDERNSENGRKA